MKSPWMLLAWIFFSHFCTPLLRADMVVVSELMFHPAEGKPEFIEIANITATPMDMAQWQVEGGVSYTFPPFNPSRPGDALLRGGQRLLLTGATPDELREAYSIPPETRVLGPWAGKLGNSGETLRVKDKNGVILCQVHYLTRNPWPEAAGGTGHSIVLRHPNRAINDWRNWTYSLHPGGSPGLPEPLLHPRPAENPEQAPSRLLIDYNTVWRYHAAGQDLGVSWRQPAYDDKSWSSGPGLLGFEEDPLPAPGLRTSVGQRRQTTVYFRTRFVCPPQAQAELVLDQIIDDGAIFYLNGREISRSRMPSGPASSTTMATSAVGNAGEERHTATLPASYLVPGTNVLAAEVHQSGRSSTDLVFGMRLHLQDLLPPAALGIHEISLFKTPFVELRNFSQTPISLSNRFFALAPGQPQSLPLTGLLAPGALVVFDLPPQPGASNFFLQLLGPEGKTVEQTVQTPFPDRSLALGRTASGNWAWFPNASRGTLNELESSTRRGMLRLNEIHFSKNDHLDWVELFNNSASALSLEGLLLSARTDFSDKIALHGQIPSRGFLVVTVDLALTKNQPTLHLVDEAGAVLDAHGLERERSFASWQVSPEGGTEWYGGKEPTRGERNAPQRSTNVVINELFYDPPFGFKDSEYVELFNRGRKSVDLSGWKLTDAVQFTFPAGTRLEPGAYAVVAANTNLLSQRSIPLLLGNFLGKLKNRGDRLRLLDAQGNLANEVSYQAEGDWPTLALGGGSSMELRHPSLDNSIPAAWADSDETGKGVWQEFSWRGPYMELAHVGAPSDYKELHLHLVGPGHVILEKIQLLQNGANLIRNADRLSHNGRSADGWLCQGTHWASYVTNGQLHVISDGRGDNRPNRVEIDLPGLTRNQVVELKFRARWVSGKPRLIAQSFDHSIGQSFLLPIPANLGTPGARNSRSTDSAPPLVSGLLHSPAVPRSTNTVLVTARISFPAAPGSVLLFHRADSNNPDLPWSSSPMQDNGRDGDAQAGDGLYTGALNNYKRNNQVVQFYVVARSDEGLSCTLPTPGAIAPALYVVDDRPLPRDLRLVRFIVSDYDLEALGRGESSKFGFRYPRLSNRYFNATFIHNEEEIFYNGQIRHSGSPWTRGSDLSRPKFKLPQDRLFRSHEKFYFDNDPAQGNFHNRVARQLLYYMGHPASENEIVRVLINTDGPDLREDTEPVGNDFLNRIYKNGSKGQLYRIDDDWWFTDDWEKQNEDASWNFRGVTNSLRYRTPWMKRTNETEDDFTSLIQFFKLVSSGQYTQEQMDQVLYSDAILKYAAVRGYIGDWDNFTVGRGKNGLFYQNPQDGRFQFFHWDSDLAFMSTPFYGGAITAWMEKPWNKRRFYYHLLNLAESYTGNSKRFQAWLQAEEEASPSYSPKANFYLAFMTDRSREVYQATSEKEKLPLLRLAKPGTVERTDPSRGSLEGKASYRAHSVRLKEEPTLAPTWRDDLTFVFKGLRLKPGENRVTVQALNEVGQVLLEESITIP